MKATEIAESVELFEVASNSFVTIKQLKDWLPTIESALWFGKLFDLNYTKLSGLLSKLFNSDVITALMAGDHSTELQDYVDDVVPDYLVAEDKPSYVEAPPPAEVLPEVWKINTIEMAKSIKEVADKLKGTLQMLPSMEGRMVFETMAKFNKQRPSIGMYQASIKHEQVPDVLVILDVSGSMREDTIRAIVDDVVGLSWEAKAHLAIVSNNAYVWEPGSYNVDDVLAMAEYGGTQYEMLAPLLDRTGAPWSRSRTTTPASGLSRRWPSGRDSSERCSTSAWSASRRSCRSAWVSWLTRSSRCWSHRASCTPGTDQRVAAEKLFAATWYHHPYHSAMTERTTHHGEGQQHHRHHPRAAQLPGLVLQGGPGPEHHQPQPEEG